MNLTTQQKHQKAKDFDEQLIKWRINHDVHNHGWHIQVQGEHHFYPSTNKYMNSESGKIKQYKDFKKKHQFMKFLRDNTNPVVECKREGCKSLFIKKEAERVYGKFSNVVLLGYCTAYCYTQETPT